MRRRRAGLLCSTAIALLAVVGVCGVVWAAGPTVEEKCLAAKLRALAKRDTCVRIEQRKDVLGGTPNEASCGDAFDAAIVKTNRQAARRGASCRWLEHGDGTATDLDTGLQWELKTDDGSIHDKDNEYTWSLGVPFNPDGAAFAEFLGTLNGGFSEAGTVITGCFASRCDWRLPTIAELRGIATCEGELVCTTIPGETVTSFYWSSTSLAGADKFAWVAAFSDGSAGDADKTFGQHVRAVRGGP